MRRVRRNIMVSPDEREVETESWGFRRAATRQPRLRTGISVGTLSQRIASLEEEIAEINLAQSKQNASISNLNKRLDSLESRGGAGGYFPGGGCFPGPGCYPGPYPVGPSYLPYNPSCALPAGPYGQADISYNGCGTPVPCETYSPVPYNNGWGPNWGPGCAPQVNQWGGQWGSQWGGPGCAPQTWGNQWGNPPGGYADPEGYGGCSRPDGSCSRSDGSCNKKNDRY